MKTLEAKVELHVDNDGTIHTIKGIPETTNDKQRKQLIKQIIKHQNNESNNNPQQHKKNKFKEAVQILTNYIETPRDYAVVLHLIMSNIEDFDTMEQRQP